MRGIAKRIRESSKDTREVVSGEGKKGKVRGGKKNSNKRTMTMGWNRKEKGIPEQKGRTNLPRFWGERKAVCNREIAGKTGKGEEGEMFKVIFVGDG